MTQNTFVCRSKLTADAGQRDAALEITERGEKM